MIRALIFDCFGVLYVDPIGELEGMTPPDKRREFQDVRRAYDRGYTTRPEYLAQLSKLTGRPSQEIGHITPGHHQANGQLLQSMRTGKSRYKIALLSNVGRGAIDELFSRDEKQLFDVVIASSDVGMTKPDPEIFRLTARRLGVEAGECVMIDDSRDNCDAARAVGMQAVVYQNSRQCLQELHILGMDI